MPANERQVGGEHYRAELQHWDVCWKHGVGYLEGCATKYPTRAFKKNGAEDVEKAVHYCDKLIDCYEQGYTPSGTVPDEVIEQFFVANGIEDANQRMAITMLWQWQCGMDLKIAKMHMEALLEKLTTAGVTSTL